MKYSPLARRLAVGVLACAAASGSEALTVGRVQGLALIGRPLDVTVPLMFEASGEAIPECSSAEVFYGDLRLRAERVSTQIEPGGAGAVVRIRVNAVVNEPVVTVYLNVGCNNRSTRRLVLLAEQADLQNEAPARGDAVPYNAPQVGSGRSATGPRAGRAPLAMAPSDAPADSAAAPASRADRRARRSETPNPDTAAARPGPGKKQAARGGAEPQQPRLKLEPLDLSAPPGDPSLRMSDTLAAPGQGTPEQRALAAALWRTLNARPEDLLREAQKLESLDNDLRSLRLSIQRNETALAEVRGKLQQAEAERYANPLVYGLAALALAAALAAAWAWRRPRAEGVPGPAGGTGPWWRAAEDSIDSGAPPGASAPRSTGRGVLPPSSRPPFLDNQPDLPVEPPPPAPPRPEFSPSMRGEDFRASNSASLRALRAEELHDVQQETDFFISLGEYDRAIEVLRSHISMNPETSAVAWLDLMEIYHKLDRRTDYEWVRRQFQHNYNAEVPEFEAYSDASAGLESYENAMTRITSLWPSRRVLDVIEESIFRGPSSDGTNAFSLQAYRDLLLLHHVGTEVVVQEEDGRTSSFFGDMGQQQPAFELSNFSHTAISPLSALSTSRYEAEPQADSSIGLDINLDEPAAVDELLIGDSQAGDSTGHAAGNLVDFDLPDIDISGMRPKKTRE